VGLDLAEHGVQRTAAAEELDGIEKLLDRPTCPGAFHKAIVPKHFPRRVRRFRDAVGNHDQMVAGLYAGLSAGVFRLCEKADRKIRLGEPAHLAAAHHNERGNVTAVQILERAIGLEGVGVAIAGTTD